MGTNEAEALPLLTLPLTGLPTWLLPESVIVNVTLPALTVPAATRLSRSTSRRHRRPTLTRWMRAGAGGTRTDRQCVGAVTRIGEVPIRIMVACLDGVALGGGPSRARCSSHSRSHWQPARSWPCQSVVAPSSTVKVTLPSFTVPTVDVTVADKVTFWSLVLKVALALAAEVVVLAAFMVRE